MALDPEAEGGSLALVEQESAPAPKKTEVADTECFSGMMEGGPDSKLSSCNPICEVEDKDKDSHEDDLDGSGENGGEECGVRGGDNEEDGDKE